MESKPLIIAAGVCFAFATKQHALREVCRRTWYSLPFPLETSFLLDRTECANGKRWNEPHQGYGLSG